MAEPVRRAIERPEGGVSVVTIEAGGALTLFRQLADESVRTGFVPVLADSDASGELPRELLHRHLAIVCDGDAGRCAAINWVRRLAQVSPRRHVVVTLGSAVRARSVPSVPPGAPARAVSVRLARAERWHRRGRFRAAERWLVAASESARRRGDLASATSLDVGLIAGLLDEDRVACAGHRLRDVLRRPGDWTGYAAAGALWTDVLIARGEFAAARAWASSISGEAELRGEPPVRAIAIRAAELDFWQGRSADRAVRVADLADADEAGWRALQAWSARSLSLVAAIAVKLIERERTEAPARYWAAMLRVLLADVAAPAEVQTRVDELIRVGVRGEAVRSRRRRRLAAVIAARADAIRPSASEVMDLLDGIRGPGPEGTAVERMAALHRPADTDPSAPRSRTPQVLVPGVHILTRSRPMHLVDSLSGLLSVIEDAGDEVSVLTGGCRWLCRQSDSARVAFVSADRTTLVAAEGWRRADLAGEIAEILAAPASDVRFSNHGAGAAGFSVSVRYGGVTVGYVVACGLPSERPALQPAAQALAALCGPALRARLDALMATQRARQAVPEFVGASPLIAAVREAITRAAPAPFPVLIEGESGTGKELVARALHRLGPRRDRRLSAVNCAALTDELVEAELFGHARGAFTGAVGQRTGLFEEAHGGTLFLDEVTELSPRAQAKLLRVLQEGEIRRVGENQARRVDVRIVAACNVPVAEAVASGRFRDDLRFRLAVIRISLPPLRERLEDVPVLAQVFWRRTAGEAGTQAQLGPDALARLTRHAWPGNVRELQNVIAGLVVAAPTRGRVGARHVEQALSHAAGPLELPGVRLEAARRTLERRVIMAALVRHASRRGAAAAELGLTRQGLTKAMRRLGLAAEEDAAGVA